MNCRGFVAASARLTRSSILNPSFTCRGRWCNARRYRPLIVAVTHAASKALKESDCSWRCFTKTFRFPSTDGLAAGDNVILEYLGLTLDLPGPENAREPSECKRGS